MFYVMPDETPTIKSQPFPVSVAGYTAMSACKSHTHFGADEDWVKSTPGGVVRSCWHMWRVLWIVTKKYRGTYNVVFLTPFADRLMYVCVIRFPKWLFPAVLLHGHNFMYGQIDRRGSLWWWIDCVRRRGNTACLLAFVHS